MLIWECLHNHGNISPSFYIVRDATQEVNYNQDFIFNEIVIVDTFKRLCTEIIVAPLDRKILTNSRNFFSVLIEILRLK